MRALKIPDFIRLDNRSVFTAEEVLLCSLHRYAQAGGNLEHDANFIFGREFSQWSKAFKWFNQHMVINFTNLMVNNFQFWSQYFPIFAEKIRKKTEQMSGYDVQWEPGTFKVIAFIDDNVSRTCRPGGGPMEEGPDAPRYDNEIQAAFYNGWKKHHGIKWQCIELPNGYNFNMYGPVSFRRSDLEIQMTSEINQKILDLQPNPNYRFILYGDSIFMHEECVTGAYVGANLTDRQKSENKAMKKSRIAVEWNFGVTSNIFPFTQVWSNLKLLQHPDASLYYFVATILRNAHNCLYGGITSRYFECLPQSLEDVFQVD